MMQVGSRGLLDIHLKRDSRFTATSEGKANAPFLTLLHKCQSALNCSSVYYLVLKR